MRRLLVLVCVAGALLSGCATTQRPDPLEPMNRKVFAFNDAVDKAVLQPVATTYVNAVPDAVRRSVGNFFANPRDLWSAVNLVLQGRPLEGLSDVARVAANTVFGVLGLFDVATPMGLVRHGEDFGQTLGRWGMGPGAYLVWPLLGPSSVRDSVGLPVDLLVVPQTLVSSNAAYYGLTALQAVDTRASLLGTTGLLDDIALDRYLFVRDAYLQRRRSLVHDGQPPPGPDNTRFDAEPPNPAFSTSQLSTPQISIPNSQP